MITMMYKVALIQTCAHDVHKGVNQKYDGYDYSFHLNSVASNVMKYIQDLPEEIQLPIIFGAYFHDSIEDARMTYHDVLQTARTFMSDDQAHIATEIVYACTNEKGRTRSERANDKYYEGIRTTPYAPVVKLCDRLSNMEYSKQMVKCTRCIKRKCRTF